MLLTSGQGRAVGAWSLYRTHAMFRPGHGPHVKHRKAKTIRTCPVAKACLHAFFHLPPRSANTVSGITAPFRVTLTKPNDFSGGPYLSLTRLGWETLYPGTAILLSALSALSGVSLSDWARLTVCIHVSQGGRSMGLG